MTSCETYRALNILQQNTITPPPHPPPPTGSCTTSRSIHPSLSVVHKPLHADSECRVHAWLRVPALITLYHHLSKWWMGEGEGGAFLSTLHEYHKPIWEVLTSLADQIPDTPFTLDTGVSRESTALNLSKLNSV